MIYYSVRLVIINKQWYVVYSLIIIYFMLLFIVQSFKYIANIFMLCNSYMYTHARTYISGSDS